MNKKIFLFILAIFTSACITNTKPSPSSLATSTPTQVLAAFPKDVATAQLMFTDEFNDTDLNSDKWMSEYVWGHTNPPELQYYSHTAFAFGDDNLRITAGTEDTHEQPYSSGIITTYDSFQFTYGYVEARIRVPSGKGLWPALWLLDHEGRADEIDITEILGDQPATTYMTLHYDGENGGSESVGDSYTGPDFSADYHIFAVDWSKESITWYIDGIERYKVVEHIPSNHMYIIANLAVGGEWPGNPDEHTLFPAYYEIDYIRVYRTESTLP